MTALNEQIGGEHYRKHKIQPVEYIIANGLGFLPGNIVKYATRYKDKGGAEDIRKIIQYCQLILEFEYGINTPAAKPSPSPYCAPIAVFQEFPYDPPKAYAQEAYGKPGTGPALILRLESDDPETVGEPHGDRTDQEGCNAPGSRQEAGGPDHAGGHKDGSGQGATRRQAG